jgi:PAS domain S-box-containing protein
MWSGEQPVCFPQVVSLKLEKDQYSKAEVMALMEQYRATIESADIEKIFASSLEEAESRFKAVFDTVLDAIVIISKKGIIEFANPAACKLFRYQQQELIGQNVNTLMIEPHRSRHDGYLWEYLKSGNKKIIGVEGRHLPALRKDGTVFPIELAVTEVKLDGGRYFVGAIHDISERLEREEELERTRDEAVASSKFKSEILMNFSHEIRTPMNGIIGCAELLNETGLSDEQRMYLNTVLDSANGLLTLLNDIIDLSRLESGRVQIVKQAFDPVRMVKGICCLFQGQATDQGLKLDCVVDEDIPGCIIGDEGHLRQLLVNLTHNALKFTEQGSITIGVGVYSRQDDSLMLEFFVEDTGIGIPEEEKDKIFSSFVQGNDVKKTVKGGLGLGLAICKRILDMMDGYILLDSEPGKGSRFYFRVPVQVE